jgi:L-fucose isomerase-like protein
MAWLTERDGIPVACEGDALGAVSLIALTAISGSMSTLVDIGPMDPETGGVLLWHLGSSPHCLADEEGVTYKHHSTLGRNGHGGPWGVVVDQVFRPTPVTVMNLNHGGTDLLVMGCAVEPGPSRGLSGDRGWSFRHSLEDGPIGLEDLLNTVLVAGLAHHCAFVPGEWTAEVTELGAWLRLGTIRRIRASRALQIDS